jgi:hypothetical protein
VGGGGVGHAGDQQAGERQHADDQRDRQVAGTQGHGGEDREGERDRPQPADPQARRDQQRRAGQQPRVRPQPQVDGVAADAVGVERAAAGGAAGELEADGVHQADVLRPWQQLAAQQGGQRVDGHHQQEQRGGDRQAVAPVAPVVDLPVLPQQRGQQQQAGLLGEHGGGEAQPGAGVRRQPAARRQDQHEGAQQERRRQVVEIDRPVEGERQRAEREQQHAGDRRGPAQPEPPRQGVEQGRAEHLDEQHQLTAGRDGGGGAREGAGQGRPGGQQQPAERRVVVPVGVVRQGAPVLHRPRLGDVGALVVDPLRRVVHADGLHHRDHRQRGEQQHEADPVAPQPLQPPPGRWRRRARRLGRGLARRGRLDRLSGRRGRRGRFGFRLACRRGRRGRWLAPPARGGALAGPGGRLPLGGGVLVDPAGGHAVPFAVRPRSASWRWAPTCAVFSQPRSPRRSRSTARNAAMPSSRWYGKVPSSSRR